MTKECNCKPWCEWDKDNNEYEGACSHRIKEPRIFVEWTSGAYLNSLDQNFQTELEFLINRFGPPSKVEYREEY